MFKYLYLEKVEFCNAWINGGVVPLSLASKYVNEERHGVFTPDENLIYQSTHDLSRLEHVISISESKDITIGEIELNGKVIASNLKASKYTEDGVVLCLSNKRSKKVAKRLGKSACVKILNIWELKEVLDAQIGVVGVAGPCEYTSSYERSHFLKSELDKWQDEYRIFWKLDSKISVRLPRGMAKRVIL